jgi:hypothetical protein
MKHQELVVAATVAISKLMKANGQTPLAELEAAAQAAIDAVAPGRTVAVFEREGPCGARIFQVGIRIPSSAEEALIQKAAQVPPHQRN